MKIERACLADVSSIAPLFDQYRVFYKQDSDPEAAMTFLQERLSGDESVVFLARHNGRAVGFTQLFPSFSAVKLQRIFILNDLFVVPEYRKMGVGSALLTRAQRFCSEVGAGGLALETATDNPAQTLYADKGWVKDTGFYHYFWTAQNQ